MVKVQDNFEIPNEIWDKLSAGEYTRSGGVIRDNHGKIVTMIDPIDLNKLKLKTVGVHVLKFALNNPTLVKEGLKIGTSVVIKKIKKKKNQPIVEEKFRETLKTYLNAVNEDELTLDLITDMIDCLDELTNQLDHEKASILLSLDELRQIISIILEYTNKLATDISIKLPDLNIESPSQLDNPIIDLRSYLVAQKVIFERVS